MCKLLFIFLTSMLATYSSSLALQQEPIQLNSAIYCEGDYVLNHNDETCDGNVSTKIINKTNKSVEIAAVDITANNFIIVVEGVGYYVTPKTQNGYSVCTFDLDGGKEYYYYAMSFDDSGKAKCSKREKLIF